MNTGEKGRQDIYAQLGTVLSGMFQVQPWCHQHTAGMSGKAVPMS